MSTWHFSAEGLLLLKQELSSDRSRFTQSEAVSALIWKRLSIARTLHRSSAKYSLLSLVCDYRSRLRPPFAADFIGNICEPNACVRLSCSELCSESGETLGRIAESIKEAYERMDDNAARAFVGLLKSLPAATDLTRDLDRFPGPDLVICDMSGMKDLDQDWGPNLGAQSAFGWQAVTLAMHIFFPKTPAAELMFNCSATMRLLRS